MKVLVKVYDYYGKQDAERVSSQYVIEDTPEKRKSVVDNEIYSDERRKAKHKFQKEKRELESLSGKEWKEI